MAFLWYGIHDDTLLVWNWDGSCGIPGWQAYSGSCEVLAFIWKCRDTDLGLACRLEYLKMVMGSSIL